VFDDGSVRVCARVIDKRIIILFTELLCCSYEDMVLRRFLTSAACRDAFFKWIYSEMNMRICEIVSVIQAVYELDILSSVCGLAV
jgi:hypothetical protein